MRLIERGNFSWARVGFSKVLPALVLLAALHAGCATPGAQTQFRGFAKSTAVPFQNGRVLGLDDHHNPAWIDDEPRGDLRAIAFMPPRPGERVTLRTFFGENPAYVLWADGPRSLIITRDPIAPGMSGGGLWRDDRFLVGVLVSREDDFPHLGEAIIPFVGEGR